MNNLFNTPFETGLRLLLILHTTASSGITIDRLVALDFMALYGAAFNITDSNLNGINSFNFSELATRREICMKGIKEFALDGLVYVEKTSSGFNYKISRAGKEYAESLDSDYARQYVSAVKKVYDTFGTLSDSELTNEINSRAVETLRR